MTAVGLKSVLNFVLYCDIQDLYPSVSRRKGHWCNETAV